MLDYYEILEVSLDASQEQIKAQYRFLAQAWHPDKFASAETKVKAEEKLKKINEAYAVLKDAVKREQFDRQRQASREPVDYQAEYEQQKRAQEQAAQEELERQTQAKHIAEELIRKITAQKAQRESPTHKMRALNVQLAPGVVMEFVRVPAGDFLMGSDTFKDPKARQDEKPQHPVYLAEYLIGQTPVTNRQYLAFLQNTGYRPPAHWQNGAILQTKENHPVVNISWADASEFCNWVNRVIGMKVRLPSEAEWEKAARGVDGRLYPWGNQAPDDSLANFNATDTQTVGERPAGMSPYGALDMLGNVWEWVNDFYNKTYYQGSPAKNPTGPVWGEYRVLRGGCFASSADLTRSACRAFSLPAGSYEKYNGFRCALSL
jgi:formylglycine-generating enzyme required for sulfatase activity